MGFFMKAVGRGTRGCRAAKARGRACAFEPLYFSKDFTRSVKILRDSPPAGAGVSLFFSLF